MKKLSALFLTIIITLLSVVYFSGCENTSTNLGNSPSIGNIADIVDPIKLKDTINCKQCTIKTSSSTYTITPAGFDLQELNKRGYKMTIEVSYEVYYTKDWNIPLDIGYLGAPKYEVYLLEDDLICAMNENVVAPSKTKIRTTSYTDNVVNLMGCKVYLKFSSDNIQNKIHFRNIKVSFSCHK